MQAFGLMGRPRAFCDLLTSLACSAALGGS
jgi:hypothetical protein